MHDNADSVKLRRQSRAGLATWDNDSGSWLLPVSDSWLNLHAGDWSEPVQLRVVREGDGWRMKIRDAQRRGTLTIEEVDELRAILNNSSERGQVNTTWAVRELAVWIARRIEAA